MPILIPKSLVETGGFFAKTRKHHCEFLIFAKTTPVTRDMPSVSFGTLLAVSARYEHAFERRGHA